MRKRLTLAALLAVAAIVAAVLTGASQAKVFIAGAAPAKVSAAPSGTVTLNGWQTSPAEETKLAKVVKDFEKSVNDLGSKDEKTRADAEKKLDQTVGEKNRREIQNIQKGLNSNDAKERQADELGRRIRARLDPVSTAWARRCPARGHPGLTPP